jgi:DNA-binding FrmR family transcriptional regulator
MATKVTVKETAKEKKAHGVDDDIKQSVLARLKRIEGQVRGIHKMIEDERYCADVLVQLSSVQEALRGVSKEMLRNHLTHCATHELTKGGAGAAHMVDELVELMHKHNR